MKSILDLTGTDLESTIQYKVSKFPDGQQTIDITDVYITSPKVEIKSRLNNFRDLELIVCATQALRNLGVKDIELYVPYFIGGRSDRKFQVGGVHYLKQVIAPIINLQEYSKVTVIDPHSDVLESVLNSFEKRNHYDFIKWALTKIDNKDGAQDRIHLVSPDAGAYKKIFDVAKFFKIPNIVTANKVRDVITGQILKTEVPITVYDAGKTFVIIDDIGDGFGTFIQIAKEIREKEKFSSVTHESSKLYLIVTHSIQEKGIINALEYFDMIFTTNSVNDYNIEKLNVYNVF